MKKSQKITMITAEYPPYVWGGIGTATWLMAKGYVLSGYEVIVITFNQSRESGKICESMICEGVKVYTISIDPLHTFSDNRHPIYSSSRSIKALTDMSESIKQFIDWSLISGSDIVILHNEELLELALHVKNNLQVPLLYFCHGLHIFEHPDNGELHSVQSAAVELSDAVVVIESHLDIVRKVFPDVICLPIRLPLALLCKKPLISAKEYRKNLLLVAAGRAVKQKGFDILLDAYCLLLKKQVILDIKIYIGHGSQDYIESFKHKFAQLGLSCEEILQPWQSWTSLQTIIYNADGLVVPSRFEPFGLIAAEAVAMETPIIVSGVGGLKELAGDGEYGYLVESHENDGPNPQDLANTIEEFCMDRCSHREIAQRSVNHLTDFYSVESFICSVNSALHNLQKS